MNALESKKSYLKENVKIVPISDILPDAIVVSSQTVYTFYQKENNILGLKSRISVHRNADSIKGQIITDC